MKRPDSTLRLRLRARSPVRLGRLAGFLWWRLDLLLHGWPLRRPPPHPAPVFILGHQKSGTSAVGALLAAATGEAAALDLAAELVRPMHEEVLAGRRPLSEFLHHNACDFARTIIKDASLTPLANTLAERFPEARFVFVVRDPRATIRSVLDRLGLDGRRERFDRRSLARVPVGWRTIILPAGEEEGDVVGHLARRWAAFARVPMSGEPPCVVVRYEEFCADRSGVVADVARAVGLPVVAGVEDEARVQWQPRGAHRGNWSEALGSANVARVEEICADGVEFFDYPRSD